MSDRSAKVASHRGLVHCKQSTYFVTDEPDCHTVSLRQSASAHAVQSEDLENWQSLGDKEICREEVLLMHRRAIMTCI